MNYIGNYKSWLDDTVISLIRNGTGERRPKISNEGYQDQTLEKWKIAGYDLSKLGWEFFYNEHIGRDHIDLPINPGTKKYKWWFSKLNPGDFFPMHVDHFKTETNVVRYWMACEDYKLGHVFVYDDGVLQKYQAGDLYEFPMSMWHGAANLGFEPKISFQMMLYD
jgi:hypothetical protein